MPGVIIFVIFFINKNRYGMLKNNRRGRQDRMEMRPLSEDDDDDDDNLTLFDASQRKR